MPILENIAKYIKLTDWSTTKFPATSIHTKSKLFLLYLVIKNVMVVIDKLDTLIDVAAVIDDTVYSNVPDKHFVIVVP